MRTNEQAPPGASAVKLIATVINPVFKRDEAREAIDVHGMAVAGVKGHGRRKGRAEIDRGGIFARPPDRAARIRTAETGDDAL